MSFLFPYPPPTSRPDDGPATTTKSPRQRLTRSDTIESAVSATEAQDTPIDVSLTNTTSRRNVVFPDPVAFRYLEQDPCVTVVERRVELKGYELYLVEQWACTRKSPTLVVVTYTGDERHSVVAGVLSVPTDETLWSTRLRVYFKASLQYHARPKDTALGELMVTNLSSFPSTLTVIHVPDGDIRTHREAFIVNEDLKRLGCSGRSGLTLTDPTEATQSKFQQLYKTWERIPFTQAVLELVKLCQVALYMFEKLDHEYVDGLLCDVTERAIGDWWTEVGAEHYNFEPTDGILGPSTVAALLGLLMGARNRLHWYGAPVTKDVFDIDNTKRGVAYFQKSMKLEKTRRLDRQTLVRLHAETAKAAVSEGWGVQKAVKSTMTEIGGKRGEIVIGMVSGKDKGGLTDIETFELHTFVSLAYGERAKWLWHGKPRRTSAEQHGRGGSISGSNYGKDEVSPQTSKRMQPTSDERDSEVKRKDDGLTLYSSAPPGSSTSITDSGDRDGLHKTVLKSVAGKMSDARSGLGRIKDAVGGTRRTHTMRPSISTKIEPLDSNVSMSAPTPTLGSGDLTGLSGVPRSFTWKNKPMEYTDGQRRADSDNSPEQTNDLRQVASLSILQKPSHTNLADEGGNSTDHDTPLSRKTTGLRPWPLSRAPSATRSVAGNAVQETPTDAAHASETDQEADHRQLIFTRRHSVEISELSLKHVLDENRWPRRMSFGDAEPALLTWDEIVDFTVPEENLLATSAFAEAALHMNQTIEDIVFDIEPWVEEKLKSVAMLDERYGRDYNELQQMYYQLSEACRRVRSSSEELLAEERAHLTESVKEIEVLVARLEYEVNALVQKANDVDDGIRNFERQVEDVERRAEQLKVQLETETWLHWFVRTMTGVGTGPNITRA